MEPIELDPQKALFRVLHAALQVDSVRIAVLGYMEGAGLEGDYRLEITRARLIPVEPKPE